MGTTFDFFNFKTSAFEQALQPLRTNQFFSNLIVNEGDTQIKMEVQGQCKILMIFFMNEACDTKRLDWSA